MAQQAAAVVLRRTDVAVEVQGAARLLLDIAAGYALAVTPTTVACHPLQGGPPEVVSIGEGPSVAAGAVSLDGRFLAVQRSPTHIQVVHRQQPGLFVQAPQKGQLLGFCWSSSPQVDLIMITHQGAEMYKVQKDEQGLRLVDRHAHPVAWWRYSHPARMLLLGTGELGIWLQAYQLTAEGVVKLPPFQVRTPTPKGASHPPAPTKLAPDDLHIVILYGGIYAVFIDRKASRLHLYRFFRDSVELQASFDAPGSGIRLLVVDSLLMALHLSSGRTGVVDVRGFQGQLLGGFLQVQAPEGQDLPPPSARRGWKYKLPGTILDPSSGAIWELQLDPAAIVASTGGPVPAAIAFLLRRAPQTFPGCDISATVLGLLKAEVSKQSPLEAVGAALQALLVGLPGASGSGAAGPSPSQEQQPQPEAQAQLSVQAVNGMLAELRADEAVPGGYLRAVLAELFAAAHANSVPVPPAAHVLDLELAVQLGLGSQVAGSLGLQRHAASVSLAEAVEAQGDAVPGSPALSVRLLSACGAHAEAVHVLLAEGQVMAAVHYARRLRVFEVDVSVYIAAAQWTGQPLLQHALEIEAQQPGGLHTGRQDVVHALPPSRQSSMLPVSDLPNVSGTSHGGLHRVVGGV